MTSNQDQGQSGRIPPFRRTLKRATSVTRLPSVTSQEINTALAGASGEVWDLAQIHEFVATRVEEILDKREVPRRDVQAPSLDIAVPAIEAMRYCRFRPEMAALIASSMDQRLAHRAHPAFVDILTQLTRDELAMLTLFPAPTQVIAYGHLHKIARTGHTELLYRSIIPPQLARLCRSRESIPTYIDNLKRLSLVAVPPSLTIQDDTPYRELMEQSFCKTLSANASRGGQIRLERGVLCLTDLGDNFRKVCLA